MKSCEASDSVDQGIPHLIGCLPLSSCTAPSLDSCLYDATACEQLQPGGSCSIHCASPYVGKPVTATCPSDNVDSGGLQWQLPTCTVTNCLDPIPVGYMKTALGWTCAPGYIGSAFQ